MPRILNLKAYSQRGYEALRFRGWKELQVSNCG